MIAFLSATELVQYTGRSKVSQLQVCYLLKQFTQVQDTFNWKIVNLEDLANFKAYFYTLLAFLGETENKIRNND